MAADWKKIKAEYIRGGTSYQKLATKYGVSFSSIRRRSEKEKWTDLRAKSVQKTNMKITIIKGSIKFIKTIFKFFISIVISLIQIINNS